MREESRGVHLRSDFPSRDDAIVAPPCADPSRPRHRGIEDLLRTSGGAMSEDADLRLVRLALAEDLAGYGDITSELTVPADLEGRAVITARTDLVVFGLDLARTVMREVDSRAVFTALVEEGTQAKDRNELARHRRTGPRHPDGREDHAQPARPSLRGGDPIPSFRAGGRRYRRHRGRHPQDRPGVAAVGETSGGPGRVSQPSLRSVRPGARSRTTIWWPPAG